MNLVQTRQARFLLMLLLASLLAILPGLGRADTYPSRPITLVIPYPPGGTADIVGRLVAVELGNQLKQTIVVQNRGGASGNIAAQAVKASAPDGYTLILGNAPMLAINPHLYKDPGFDPIKDFAPIAPIADVPLFLIANRDAPYNSLKEYVEWSKKNAAKATYASGSAGSTTNLAMELFMKDAGFHALHIPYKGSGPALTALVAGDVPIMFELLPSAQGFVKGGRVKALAVTSLERQPTWPDVPTVAESGYPGFQVASWFGVLAPAGTPQPVLDTLSNAARAVAKAPQLRTRLLQLGAAPMSATRAEFAAMIKSELAKWETAVKISGAKPE